MAHSVEPNDPRHPAGRNWREGVHCEFQSLDQRLDSLENSMTHYGHHGFASRKIMVELRHDMNLANNRAIPAADHLIAQFADAIAQSALVNKPTTGSEDDFKWLAQQIESDVNSHIRGNGLALDILEVQARLLLGCVQIARNSHNFTSFAPPAGLPLRLESSDTSTDGDPMTPHSSESSTDQDKEGDEKEAAKDASDSTPIGNDVRGTGTAVVPVITEIVIAEVMENLSSLLNEAVASSIKASLLPTINGSKEELRQDIWSAEEVLLSEIGCLRAELEYEIGAAQD